MVILNITGVNQPAPKPHWRPLYNQYKLLRMKSTWWPRLNIVELPTNKKEKKIEPKDNKKTDQKKERKNKEKTVNVTVNPVLYCVNNICNPFSTLKRYATVLFSWLSKFKVGAYIYGAYIHN